MILSRSPASRLFRALVAGIFVVVAFAPLAAALWQTLVAADFLPALRQVLAEPRQWRLLGTTLLVAAGTAALASALGFIPGVLLARPRFRGHTVLALALATPLLLPPYVVANTWVDLLGTHGVLAQLFDTATNFAAPGLFSFNVYNVGGVIIVLALTYFPLATGCTAIAWRRVDHAAVEASRVYAGVARTFWRVQLPLAAPGIVAGALAVFLLALLSFAVPSLLQVQVYTVEIYTRFSSFFDTPGAIAQALPLLALGFATLFLLQRFTGRWAGGPGIQRPSFLPVPPTLQRAAIAWSTFLALGAAGLPAAVVAWRAGAPAEIFAAWSSARDEIATSLLLAGLAATAAVTLALAMACIERARPQPITSRLFSASALPFLVSGPVLGVGLIHLWNHAPVLSHVYDSLAILVLACLARCLVFAHLGLRAVLAHLGPGPEEAAAACGAGPFRRLTGILLPLLSPALVLLWGLVFVLSLGELDAVVLVAPPGWTPLSVRVFSLLHYGPSQSVSALCLLSLLIMLATGGLCAAAYALSRKVWHVRR